ncbi:MAG: CopG family transcriptional regulator [Ruminococcus sp.]|nr:CopG family transcriptional regulator [Ruminococcus sp.]
MKKLEITAKSKEEKYRTLTIRTKITTLQQLDEMAALSNRSRNELINIFLEFGISNCIIRGAKER